MDLLRQPKKIIVEYLVGSSWRRVLRVSQTKTVYRKQFIRLSRPHKEYTLTNTQNIFSYMVRNRQKNNIVRMLWGGNLLKLLISTADGLCKQQLTSSVVSKN